MINIAGLKFSGVTDASQIIDTYNVLRDPVIASLGILDKIKQAFEGETVLIENVKIPLEVIRRTYVNSFKGLECIFHDGLVFPIKDSRGKVIYVVIILIPKRIYSGKKSIVKAVEFMDAHWLDEFCLDDISKAVHLSPFHFSRSFKCEMGISPYKYYMNIKIEKIKEKLVDTNISIQDAFSSCGINYNGYFSKVFKQKTGMTPSAYRKSAKEK